VGYIAFGALHIVVDYIKTWLEVQERFPGADIHRRCLYRMKRSSEESPDIECHPCTALHAAYQLCSLAYSPCFVLYCHPPLQGAGSRRPGRSSMSFVRRNSRQVALMALCCHMGIAMLESLDIGCIGLLVGGHSAGRPFCLLEALSWKTPKAKQDSQ